MTIRVQYVTGTVPVGVTQHTLTAPTHFQALGSLSSAFILPAATMPTVGLGAVAGATQMRIWALNCDINSTTTILLNRANSSNPTEFAFWIIEYIGAPGGPNEFIMRAKRIFAFAPGSTTANSNSIADITNAARCVPFITGRHSDVNTNALRHFLAEARMHVSGGNNVIALTRVLTDNGEPTYVCYCVEFTGSNWTIQTGTASNWNSSSNKDITVTPISINKAWLHGYFVPGNRDTPAGQTWYAWMLDNDTLRTRAIEVGSQSTLRFWLISNSDVRFISRFYSFVDGVADITGGSAVAQSRDITIDTTPNNGTVITGWAGSSSTSTLEQPAGQWRISRSSATTAQIYRTRSLGSSEYVLQALVFPADEASLVLEPVTGVVTLTAPDVNGPVIRTPAPALLGVQGFGLFTEVTRTPAPAALQLTGNSVIPIAIYPGPATLSFENAALGDIPKTAVLDIPIPALDYEQKLNAPPTVTIGTVLTPDTGLVSLVALTHAATEGGNINARVPDTAVLTFTGQLAAVGLESTTTAGLPLVGLAPTVLLQEGIIEPGVGLMNSPGFEARPVGVFIPHQWIDVEPAPVVNWV